MVQQQNCPCNQTLSDAQVNTLNFGLNDLVSVLNDPNAAAIGAIRAISQDITSRLGNTPAVAGIVSKINAQNEIINRFEQESARLSTTRGLMSTIGSLNAYAEMLCMLGIEGVNVGVGLSVINQDGQFSIQAVLNANIDIQRVLNNLSGGVFNETTGRINAELSQAFANLNQSLSVVDNLLSSALQMQSQAFSFIERFTSLSFITDLINQANNDPCFRFSSEINGGIINQDFSNAVKMNFANGIGHGFR